MSTHTKPLGVTVAIIAVFTLGACGGGGSSKPATAPKHPATSYVAPKVTAPHGTDPVALARTLGCTDPTVTTIGAIPGFPVPAQHVDCVVSGGELTVNTFTAADMRWWASPLNRAKYCQLLERSTGTPVTFYGIQGSDYSAHIDATGGGRAGSRAQADALGPCARAAGHDRLCRLDDDEHRSRFQLSGIAVEHSDGVPLTSGSGSLSAGAAARSSPPSFRFRA